MPANNVTVARVANLTTDAALVDTVTVPNKWPVVEVLNRSAATIYVTMGTVASPPANPTLAGAECFPVQPNERVVVIDRSHRGSDHQIKVIGASSAYSVIASSRVSKR